MVTIADHGLATGATLRAAVTALREHRPARIIVSVPIGAPRACATLASLADEAVCAVTPEPFHSVREWCTDFRQTSDEEVQGCRPSRRASERLTNTR